MWRVHAHRCSVELAAGPEDVWRALTDSGLLSEWFGAWIRIDALPGGRAVFRFQNGRERTATVEAVQPERLLSLRWLPFYKDRSGVIRQASTGHLRFVITSTGESTLLEVENSIGLGLSDYLLEAVG
jgi:uncharacterized protein YndB with AHSA1/START domain